MRNFAPIVSFWYGRRAAVKLRALVSDGYQPHLIVAPEVMHRVVKCRREIATYA